MRKLIVLPTSSETDRILGHQFLDFPGQDFPGQYTYFHIDSLGKSMAWLAGSAPGSAPGAEFEPPQTGVNSGTACPSSASLNVTFTA